MTDVLDDLRWHWGEAYRILIDSRGWWLAVARDGTGEVLVAVSSAELRRAIRADYGRVRRTSAAPTPGGEPTS